MSFRKAAGLVAETKYSTKSWDRDIRFVREYLRDPNATRAARRAGVGASMAKQEGHRLLQIPWIGDLIMRGMDRRWRHAMVDTDDVILELKRVGFANIWNYLRLKEDGSVDLDFSALTKDSAAGIVRITIEYSPIRAHPGKRQPASNGDDKASRNAGPGGRPQKILPGQQVRKVTIQLADKLKALELLGKTKNMFHEVEDEGRPVSPSATIDAIIERFNLTGRGPAELEALLLKVRTEEGEREPQTRPGEGALPDQSSVVAAAHDEDVRPPLGEEED